MSGLAFCKRWAGYLAAKTNLMEEQEVVLAYIIEVLVINAVNVLLMLLLGFLLGVLPGTVACLVMAALFRHLAGGAHSRSPWRCAFITILIFPALALLAAYLDTLGQATADALSAAAIVTGFIIILTKAPVDSPAAPILSPIRRKRLKFLSMLAMALVAAAIIFFRQSALIHASQIKICLILSTFWICLILSKPGEYLFVFIDNINFPITRERRCRSQ